MHSFPFFPEMEFLSRSRVWRQQVVKRSVLTGVTPADDVDEEGMDPKRPPP